MKVRLLVMDVDGTLTDGHIYIGKNGECMKAFHVKDGYAINHLLKKYQIEPMIITGRSSEIVKQRCHELGISTVIQGETDKLAALTDYIDARKIPLEHVAFIGDDIPDLECMKKAGVTGCPSDAVDLVKAHAQYISPYKGGEGVVRDFIEWIINNGE